MEINLTNNAAWKKKEPPTLIHNHDKKGNAKKEEGVKGLWCF